MKKIIIDATELANNSQFEEAYQLLTDYLNDNPNDIDALYTRGIIDCIHIKKNLIQTINDFEQVIKKSNKYKPVLEPFLTLLNDINENADKVIEYGEKCQDKVDKAMQLDIWWALARAYFTKNNPICLDKALIYINKCLDNAEEDIEDYYYCKCEILLAQCNFDELNELLDNCYLKFQGSFNYYYLKARYYLFKGISRHFSEDPEEEKNLLLMALNELNTAEAYVGEDKYKLISLKVEILTGMGKIDEAIILLDELIKWFPEDDIVIEKLKVYEDHDRYDEAKELCRTYLLKDSSWKIAYAYGYLLSVEPKSIDDLEKAKELLTLSYQECKQLFVVNDLYRVNKQLHYEEDNIKLLDEAIKANPDDNDLIYYKAETANKLNYNYKEICNLYLKVYKNGAISEFEYIDNVICIDENPNKYYRRLIKYQKMDIDLMSAWMKRRTGIRFLYGEDGYPKDLNKGFTFLSASVKDDNEISCYHSSLGRAYELIKKPNEAFKEYTHGYDLLRLEVKPFCNCAMGYLAHAYLNGIGVEKDKQKAKELILEAIKNDGEFSSNIIIYLYAYFYLTGENGFDGKLVKRLLENQHPFYRYEVTKYVMLKQVNKSLGIIDKEFENKIKKAWKYWKTSDREYYKRSLNEKVSYPCFNNY